MASDAELLLRYVNQGDERAFEEVVRLHLGVVYSAALRRTGNRADLAEEITQKVFCGLARKAAWLVGHPTLLGWLHRCTRNAAIEAFRSESRRQALAHSLSTMSDESTPKSEHIDWDRLRPVLDQSIDRLKAHDREIILLRFFQGLTFTQVGDRLNIPENTARMRANRAVEKLRVHLATRGVTSSAAALSLMLTHPALASAPIGMTSTVTAVALASAPIGATAGAVSFLIMSKITAPLISAVVAASLVTTVWYHSARGMNTAELRQLRAENSRLSQVASGDEFPRQMVHLAEAIASHRASQTAASVAHSAPAVSDSATHQSNANTGDARSIANASSAKSPHGHQWCGQSTPLDAAKSFAWAADMTDVAALTKVLWFSPALRERASQILATMPASIQAEYPTPEAFYAFAIAADALIHPPPVAETLSNFHVVELSEGRSALRRAGSDQNYHEYQLTPDGWKFVVPAVGVELWPNNLTDDLVLKLASHK